MRSKVVLLLGVMVLGVVLVGCSAAGADVEPEDDVAPTEEPTTEVTESPTDEPTEAPTIDPAGGIMPEETDEPTGEPDDAAEIDIVATLQAADASVEVVGEIEQPFMPVIGTALKVNGADVQAFEFESVEAAQEVALALPADGTSFETIMITWVDVPHFYQYENYVVLYVGSDQEILDLLTMLLGEQVAGG